MRSPPTPLRLQKLSVIREPRVMDWDAVRRVLEVGTEHCGKITRQVESGVLIDLKVAAGYLSWEQIATVVDPTQLRLGQFIKCRVVSIDAGARKIVFEPTSAPFDKTDDKQSQS